MLLLCENHRVCLYQRAVHTLSENTLQRIPMGQNTRHSIVMTLLQSDSMQQLLPAFMKGLSRS